MKEYNFTFKFKLHPDKDLATHLDELCEAGCDDALVGCGQEGWLAMDFTRFAGSMKTAIESAMEDVRIVVGEHALIEIEHNEEVPIENILNDFAKNLLDNQEDLGPEFQKIIDDNYWELITEDDKV